MKFTWDTQHVSIRRANYEDVTQNWPYGDPSSYFFLRNPPIEHDETQLLATLINCGFHGILCVQVYTYYMAFPKDRIAIKILVYGLFVIETLQTLLIVIDGFDVFATHMGDVLSLDEVRLYWLSAPVIGGLVAAVGQLFFAYRLRVVSKTWILPITVTLLSICATIATLVIAARIHKAGTISSVFTDCFVPALLSHLANILCDIEIVIAMVYYLSRHNTISSSRLHRQVKRLIKLVLETGMLTTTANILSFILYIAFKHSTYFVIPYVMIPKLYSNTLTLILNNRMNIQGGRDDTDSGNGTVSLWSTNTTPNWRVRTGPKRGDPMPSTTGENTTSHEAWSEGINLDHIEAVHNGKSDAASNV